ncbi:MFS transporter [Pseudomonas kulmbachensis]|uniref:MFS transporter n=1 Tax=Pseudomonas kulmbachensis TaxID=3043408 RepID=A0ABW7LVD7_9PSED
MHALEKIDSKKSLLAICAMMLASLGTIQIQPIMGGAFVDQLALPLNAIGTIFAAELIAMAVACGISAMMMPRIDRRRFVLIALTVLILGNLLSTRADSWLLLMCSRLICGLGGGGVMAVVFATAGLRTSKDATFAVINSSNLLWGMLVVSLTPLVLMNFGVNGAFLILAATGAIALIGTARIPTHFSVKAGSAKDSIAPLNLTSLLLILLFALLFLGHSAMWTYQERIGRSIGLEPQQIGAILGASILAGAIGSALAGIIKRRMGLLAPQLISFSIALVATLIMVYGNTPLAFAATAGLIHLSWFFSLPYLLSMSAELDPSGRLAGLGNAAVFVGQGAGPFGAALVVGEGNFRAVGWLSSTIYILALVIACIVAARFRRISNPKIGDARPLHPIDDTSSQQRPYIAQSLTPENPR